jgi:paraquat-inducible protein B
MSDPDDPAASPPPQADLPSGIGDDTPPPRPLRRRWRGPSLVWLVPIVALAVGVSLLVRSLLSAGPTVTIDFRTADGLRPGQTEVRYKEVVVGRVESVSLSEDRKLVHVTVRLDRSVANIAVDDTRFWVVKPRIDIGGVSGLETLFSGAYIGVDAGVSTEDRYHFDGLDGPPFVLRGEPGRGFVLRTKDLGSLDVGSPIFYRRTRVGRVVGYKLDTVSDQLLVQIFIESPYESLVNAQTRFWNASGVDLTINADGLTVNTQTLASVLSGGIAFERLPEYVHLPAAPDGSGFALFNDRKSALAPPDGEARRVRMVFDQTVRGLSVGAPIDFLGIDIGNVKAISLNYDRRQQRFPVEVLADIYPLRLGAVREAMQDGAPSDEARDVVLLKRLVDGGLRAQARTGNLITGQMYVALDFMPNPRRASLDTHQGVPTIPTVRGTLSEVQPQIAEIVNKVNRIPFDDIGRNLSNTLGQAGSAISELRPEAQKALAEVQRTLVSAQESLGRADRNLLDPGAPLQRNAEQTLLELQRAAQSLRTLTDYLERHPESLLRGKPDDPKLPSR